LPMPGQPNLAMQRAERSETVATGAGHQPIPSTPTPYGGWSNQGRELHA
jgi:hypothetical protein